jgi:hypothetical protein
MRPPKMLVCVVLLLFAICPASAQWEHIGDDNKGGALRTSVPSSPHPLQFYLTPSRDRDPGNSLCLGCKVNDGQEVSLQDYAVETSKQVIGESFGKKILQIELSFNVKQGSVIQHLNHEWEEKEERAGRNVSFDNLVPVKWKSIVMESSADMYNELYFIVDDRVYVRPLSKARLLEVGGAQLLATNDPIDGTGGFCTEGYWVLQPNGPWWLDFTAVHEKIEKLITDDAVAMATGCWALSIDKGEVRSPVQGKDAECRSCDNLGTVVVRFRIDGHRAVPVSSFFKH